jgi:RNA 2',3'-cyclic 3'-phosphodiesterase
VSRYFVAVVPEGLAENPTLKQLVGKMKRTLSDREREVRWVAPVLWHVTLQFLGELAPERKQALMDLLNEWQPKVSELNLRLQGLGGFPASDQARVLWLGVQENQALLDLQAELGTLLRERGFETEAREYTPHLTLARLRNPQSVTDLVGLGGRKHFGDYKISDLIMFESVLQGNIIKYMPQLRRSLFNETDSVPPK